MVSELIDLVPRSIQSFAHARHQQWRQSEPRLRHWLAQASQQQLLGYCRLLCLSDYADSIWRRTPEPLSLLDDKFEAVPEFDGVELNLTAAERELRRWRQRNQFRLIYQDLLPSASSEQSFVTTTSRLSLDAERVLLAALRLAHADQLARPTSEPIREWLQQPLEAIAMGKLGAGELNLSSDVDLILVMPTSNANTQVQDRVERFYRRVAQVFLDLVHKSTADGRVLRVDLRLRPFGASSAIVIGRRALLDYYQQHGREWERYALLKARLLGDGEGDGCNWLDQLQQFVYRPFRDFRSLAQLRELRQLIAEQPSDAHGLDIKRCPGGIRDAEFVVQALQLINGGRYRSLQRRGFLAATQALQAKALLTPEERSSLDAAYLLLRHTEHKIQARADRQSHTWPQDRTLQERIAFALGLRADELEQRIAASRQTVLGLIDKYLGTGEQTLVAPSPDTASAFDLSDLEGKFAHRQQEFRSLCQQAQQLCARGEIGADYGEPLKKLLASIAGRANYLALLLEAPQTLAVALNLMQRSAWCAAQICQHPLILEHFAVRSGAHPERDSFAELQRHYLDYLSGLLAEIPDSDLEVQMDVLRRFKLHSHMHVARLDLLQDLPLMLVSDHLSAIADALLTAAASMAWQQLLAKLGVRPSLADGAPASIDNFMVLGMGKLGGIELGYGSDCDMVFLYDPPSAAACLVSADAPEKARAEPMSNQQFFLRLGQRILHLLSSYTTAGRVFATDLRLRPQGNKGLLVSNIDAYADYQSAEAWTFETQALTRSRVVSAGSALRARFDGIRAQCLQRERSPQQLQAEIVAMRQRIASNKTQPRRVGFDLKLGAGGLVDIEFLVQYLLLQHAQRHPSICEHSDNCRQLDALLAGGLLDASIAEQLRACWLELRQLAHSCQLQSTQPEASAIVSQDRRPASCDQVIAAWRKILGRHWNNT